MNFLGNKKFMNESELRSLVKVLLEDKTLGSQMVKVNPVVDPSAALTDPTNPDYKPTSKQELQVALTAMMNDLPDDNVPSIYDALKHAIQSQEEDKGKDQMAKSNDKIEESIRMMVRQLLENIELPQQIKEYFAVDPATGEKVWKGSGPAPKLAPSASIQKFDPSARGVAAGPQSPAGKSLKSTFKKMKDSDISFVDSSQPEAGRARRNKMQEGDKLKNLAVEMGFKNPNGVLQFINRVLEKMKRRFENYDAVAIATLEVMKEYIDELSSPYKSGSKTLDPLITPQDAELMKQHPEMISDLETFRIYLDKKLRQRGL
jgi:hypothetical protein